MAVAWRPDSGALALTADSHQRDEYSYERADLWIVDLNGLTKRLTTTDLNTILRPGRRWKNGGVPAQAGTESDHSGRGRIMARRWMSTGSRRTAVR